MALPDYVHLYSHLLDLHGEPREIYPETSRQIRTDRQFEIFQHEFAPGRVQWSWQPTAVRRHDRPKKHQAPAPLA